MLSAQATKMIFLKKITHEKFTVKERIISQRQYFPVVLFIMLHKVVLTFEPVCESCDL